MLPMGTIMTVCMLTGVVFGARLWERNPLNKLPRFLHISVAVIVLLAGLWNVLWYASQHLGEFWGNAALVSGLLMIVTANFIYKGQSVKPNVGWLRALVLLMLSVCCFLYGFTIYNL